LGFSNEINGLRKATSRRNPLILNQLRQLARIFAIFGAV